MPSSGRSASRRVPVVARRPVPARGRRPTVRRQVLQRDAGIGCGAGVGLGGAGVVVARAAGKSTRQVKEMLPKWIPTWARPVERMRPVGAGRWELKAVIDDDCRSGLDQLKGLLSHVDPQMTLGELLGGWFGKRSSATTPSRPAASAAPARRHGRRYFGAEGHARGRPPRRSR